MHCLFDNQELYTFNFIENFNLGQIESKVTRSKSLPFSAVIAALPIDGTLLVFNQTGRTDEPIVQTGVIEQQTNSFALGTWSTKSTAVTLNPGPILDFQLGDHGFYCIGGLSPASALYETRSGISATSEQITVDPIYMGQLSFDDEIDCIPFCFKLHSDYICLIRFLTSGTQVLLRFNDTFDQYQVLDSTGFDLENETLASGETVTSNGWRLFLQVVIDNQGILTLNIIDSSTLNRVHSVKVGEGRALVKLFASTTIVTLIIQKNDREIIVMQVDITEDIICKHPQVIALEHDVTAFTFCHIDQNLYVASRNLDLTQITAISPN